jgi:hypothetical protein
VAKACLLIGIEAGMGDERCDNVRFALGNEPVPLVGRGGFNRRFSHGLPPTLSQIFDRSLRAGHLRQSVP